MNVNVNYDKENIKMKTPLLHNKSLVLSGHDDIDDINDNDNEV